MKREEYGGILRIGGLYEWVSGDQIGLVGFLLPLRESQEGEYQMNQVRLRVFCLMLSDVFCFLLVLFAMSYFYILLGVNEEGMSLYTRLWPCCFALLCFCTVGHLYHGNIFYPGSALDPVEELRKIFYSVSLTYFVIFFWMFMTRQTGGYSRLILVSSWGATVFLLPMFRIVVRRILKVLNIGQIPVLIAGASATGQRIAKELDKDSHFGFRVVGFLDDFPKEIAPELNVKVLGKLSDAGRVAAETNADYVICALPIAIVRDVVNQFCRFFRHISIIPDNHILPISWAFPVNLLNSYASVEICNQLLLKVPRIWKILFEACLSGFAILTLSPLLGILALLVKLTSRGPVFYRAKRIGLGGKPIRVLKFRTMYINADKRLASLLAENPEMQKEWQEKFKLEHDPRVTPFGRFLRKSSLDELPQLLNVLRGDMSLIGPRPIVKAELHYYKDNQELLSRVKPGITGLWQVSGRSNLDYETRVRLDVNYVVNWSIWLDYYILLRTVIEVLIGRGAK